MDTSALEKTYCLHFQGLNELVEDAFTLYKRCVVWPGTLNQNYLQQGQFPYGTRNCTETSKTATAPTTYHVRGLPLL